MTRCSYFWTGAVGPCPCHPGTGQHQCKRQAGHDPKQPIKSHTCKCGATKARAVGLAALAGEV